MRLRRRFIGIALAALTTPLFAQSARKAAKVGVIRWDSETPSGVLVKGLSTALLKHGYTEGKNIAILWRTANESAQRADEIVQEFVRERVDVIVAAPTPAAHAAARGTATIPIVLAGIADPVASGLVKSIARPGGNVTGLSLNIPGVAAKRVEVIKDAFPTIRRIAFLGSSTDPVTPSIVANTEHAATKLGMTVHVELVEGSVGFESAFAKIASAGTQALIVQPIFFNFGKQLGALALKYRLPSISDFSSFARDGLLMSYGVDRSGNAAIVADYVDKILKGAKPADLPIQEPTRFELVVNQKTAKALGVSVAPFVLDRADLVIR